jgi:hypothetical protein
MMIFAEDGMQGQNLIPKLTHLECNLAKNIVSFLDRSGDYIAPYFFNFL